MTIETSELYDGTSLTPIETTSRDVPPEELTERRRQATGQPLDRDAYNAVRAQMQTLRALRQLGRNGFMALAAAERERQTYDALQAVTEILLVVLRDEP